MLILIRFGVVLFFVLLFNFCCCSWTLTRLYINTNSHPIFSPCLYGIGYNSRVKGMYNIIFFQLAIYLYRNWTCIHDCLYQYKLRGLFRINFVILIFILEDERILYFKVKWNLTPQFNELIIFNIVFEKQKNSKNLLWWFMFIFIYPILSVSCFLNLDYFI